MTSEAEGRLSVTKFISHIAPLVRYPFQGEQVSCPVCAGPGRRIACRGRKWKLLTTDVCNKCGLFFTNPMPTAEELDDYYKAMYRSSYLLSFRAPPKSHVEKKRADASNRASIVAEIFKGRAGLRSLDFGCGLGELVESLESEGFEAYGFEPGDVWSQHTGNPRIARANWQTVVYESNSFDFISILHVLEHLRSPMDCLAKIATLLKDDGLLWIEVPNMQAYGTKNYKRFHFAHVLGFSRENLIYAAWKCGFYPLQEISKERIGKRRSQVSIVFRKRKPDDEFQLDLSATAEKNWREYSEFSSLRKAISDIGTNTARVFGFVRKVWQ
jgi:SAM-dependent methyltransferase